MTILKTVRETLGLSLDELAERATVEVRLIRRMESGRHLPSRAMRDHLARVVAGSL